jgi:molybdopterin molybdotransferase
MSRSAADCFAPDSDMLRAERAVALLLGAVECRLGAEAVPLRRALGRVLAEPVVSRLTVPPHDNSAVDGYAVNADDLPPEGEVALPVAVRIAAGHPAGAPLPRGSAARIFTGAPMPAGADTVIPQEACRVERGPGEGLGEGLGEGPGEGGAGGEIVVLPGGVRRGSNRRRAGEDIRAGDAILSPGRRLRAQDLGLAASVGLAELPVRRRLRVAVFSTGDELREPGSPLPEGCIHDSNRYVVPALLEGLGAEVSDLGILPDRAEAVRAGIEGAAASHDLIVTSGGVSTGEEDHVKAAVSALGGLHFWRIAVRPGRPLAVGLAGGVPFVGLPGNPVAAMATFLMVVRPMVLRLMGADPAPPAPVRARAAFAFKKRPGRREWLRARLSAAPGPDGLPLAERFPNEGSGILTSMAWATGLLDLPEETAGVAEGDLVDFVPFDALLG